MQMDGEPWDAKSISGNQFFLHFKCADQVSFCSVNLSMTHNVPVACQI